jgi:plasmid stabilization system protein ParE
MRVVDGLKAMPRMGRRAGAADALEFVIPRTPFSLIYRIEGDVLMILRVWDDRQASKPRV